MDAISRLGVACRRYGLGRLPLAERHDVGAGYAGAATALFVTLFYALVARAMDVLGSPIGSDWRFLATMALFSLPLVVPSAFVSALVTWRALPDTFPYFGVVGGFVATVGTYVTALGVVFAAVTVLAASSTSSAPVADAIAFTGFVGFVAFTMTCWLTLPIGSAGGALYERVGRVARRG